MTIEIRELHIRVNVSDEKNDNTTPALTTTTDVGPKYTNEKSVIIATCVEQVMEILKEKMEA